VGSPAGVVRVAGGDAPGPARRRGAGRHPSCSPSTAGPRATASPAARSARLRTWSRPGGGGGRVEPDHRHPAAPGAPRAGRRPLPADIPEAVDADPEMSPAKKAYLRRLHLAIPEGP
jgi:hypothetical protein